MTYRDLITYLLRIRGIRGTLSVGLAVLAMGCASTHGTSATAAGPAAQIAQQLERYRTGVMAMDYDAIAAVFTVDAVLSHEAQAPVTGRAAIRKFLMSFAAYHVTSYDLIADSTARDGTHATTAGRYAQTVRLPDSTTVSVAGSFSALWRLDTDGTWRISSMHTVSPPKS